MRKLTGLTNVRKLSIYYKDLIKILRENTYVKDNCTRNGT